MSVTIAKLTKKNPGLFRHAQDLDKSVDEARFLVHDSMDEFLEYEKVFYILIAQMCSVMSVYWVQDKVGVAYKDLSSGRQTELALIVARNNSPADQFDWAKGVLKYTEVDKDAVLKLGAGVKVLIYTPRHVSAAVVTADAKWRIYDPEVASAEEYTVANAQKLYLDHASRFMHGK